jgi:hypothetical protein
VSGPQLKPRIKGEEGLGSDGNFNQIKGHGTGGVKKKGY